MSSRRWASVFCILLGYIVQIDMSPTCGHYLGTVSSMDLMGHLPRRLNVYGLCELKVSSDGNCQFRALSDQLYRSSEYHKQVRGEVVKQVRLPVSVLGAHIPFRTSFPSYSVVFTWRMGDHITLQAAADRFAAKICLLTSFRDTCFIEILPQDQAPKRAYGKCTLTKLWLYMFGIVHYNSLYDNQAVPVQQKPKRKHWLF
ncbi:BnaAnng12500D [Brassica napus]|uniref:(rape) hypothetical protein n=1 Tax=Brassica napus TaxID=3708 RepID=A0A078IWE5_BRANA|nr:unnamed protein product [Brassica napus]CDY53709.1 BnaAnng12500D [Brassica napus]